MQYRRNNFKFIGVLNIRRFKLYLKLFTLGFWKQVLEVAGKTFVATYSGQVAFAASNQLHIIVVSAISSLVMAFLSVATITFGQTGKGTVLVTGLTENERFRTVEYEIEKWLNKK